MINVNEIYLDCLDLINSEENGVFTFPRFNRFSWIGQLRMIDWLSGDVSGNQPPQPYTTQKSKDWLSDFIVKYSKQVTGGFIDKPADYYQWDNGYKIGGALISDCDEDDDAVVSGECNIPIELLDGSKFYSRCNTDISELKPSFKKPICKMVGKTFQFLPADLGSVEIEYIRYPAKAVLKTKNDQTYNEPVYDSATSIDFEWPEFARNILVWFIVDAFANRTREQALKQFNTMSGKTPREAK